jgi:Ydr279p protein family (RNase H2 complex component) wHTH domain/Ydr279p protein triple barrel domain
MGVQTRSSASSSPVKSKAMTKVILPSSDEEAYKIFILPSETSRDARFVLLSNPRNGARCRYFFCPQKGLFEITKVNTNSLDPRSILFAPDVESTSSKLTIDEASSTKAALLTDDRTKGYVNKSAEMFVCTALDPVFMLLPVLDRPTSNQNDEPRKGLFQPLDDLLDEQLNDDRHLRHVLTNSTFRPELLKAMNQICDSVDAGDEQMFRLSMPNLYRHILHKAQRAVEKGLPASLEDRFVTRALEAPMLGVKREDSAVTCANKVVEVASGCPTPDASESQSSAASTIASVAVSEASSATSVGNADITPPTNIYYLQRLRAAILFITASYLESSFAARLAATAHDSKAFPDFGPLDEHLQNVAKLRAEALATRSVSDFSKKRNFDDDEAAEERAEKKRRQEEEDKKKRSQESRGIRNLKKVNVAGMKKMGDFFAKKSPISKPKS